MTILTWPASSEEFVPVLVTRTLNGTRTDPSGDLVEIAVTVRGAVPIVSDWAPASWLADTAKNRYVARRLVSGKAVGRYDIWCRVTDSPEIPIRKTGELILTPG